MRTTHRGLRRTVSPLLASVMLVLSVAVPVLDTDGAAPAPVMESEHAPGVCVAGHDHSLCTQAGASRPLPSAEARVPLPVLRHADVAVAPERALHEILLHAGHGPRAPPVA